MTKILFYKAGKLQKEYIKKWQEDKKIDVDIHDEFLNSENASLVKNYDALVATGINEITKEVLDVLIENNHRQISITPAGYDHIDINYARENKFVISNVSDYSPESIAEFTVMMILKKIRNDSIIQEYINNKKYKQSKYMQGKTLKDKTIGIIGMGRIGSLLAKYMHAFDMKVIAYSPHPKKSDFIIYKDNIENLCKEADIISVHAKYSQETHHMIKKEHFDLMKPTAYFINAARGELADTKALLDAIDEGKISGAALDVFENEKEFIPSDNKKIEDKNILRIINNKKIDIYPHVAYFTDTSIKNQIEKALNYAKEYIETSTIKDRII